MLLNCGGEEDSWESLAFKEIQPAHPKGDQSWLFIGRTDAEAEAPILWLPDGKSWLIWKDPDARKHWRQEEKGTTEDEMVGWHHWINGHEFGWTPGVGDGQGGLACYSSWSQKESDMTEQLNWYYYSSWTWKTFVYAEKHGNSRVANFDISWRTCLPLEEKPLSWALAEEGSVAWNKISKTMLGSSHGMYHQHYWQHIRW